MIRESTIYICLIELAWRIKTRSKDKTETFSVAEATSGQTGCFIFHIDPARGPTGAVQH